MSLLEVEALSMEFGGVRAIADLSFEVAPGAIHSIIGPNGAGKTTLFNLITGIYAPSDGRIVFEGGDITGKPPHVLAARGISRTFQNLQIFYNMTVLENVMVGRHRYADTRLLPTLLRLPGVVRSDRACREKAQELLRFVGLDAHQASEAHALPYGGLKRLEIARALAGEPKLLLLDEPAAGCNARESRELAELIRKVAKFGVTIVLVEHDMHLVMGISHRVLVLDSGRRLAEGSAEEVRANREVVAAYLGGGAAAGAA
jgi:branched-chain amino acid transport system ATP-binding protein